MSSIGRSLSFWKLPQSRCRTPHLTRLNNHQRFQKPAVLYKRRVGKELYRTLARCRLGTRYSRNYPVRDRQKPMWIGPQHQNNTSPMSHDNSFYPKGYEAHDNAAGRNRAPSMMMSAIHVVSSRRVGCHSVVDRSSDWNCHENLQYRARRGR